jgi:hypothetical protein
MKIDVEWLNKLDDSPRSTEFLPEFLEWMGSSTTHPSIRTAVQQGWQKLAQQGSNVGESG